MTNKNTDSFQGGDGGNVPPPPGPGGPGQHENTNIRSGNKVYKSGPLFLSSKGIGWTSWKKRWFILTSTTLVFFRNDPNAISPKGSEVNLTLGGIDLNSSGSVVIKEDKKLLTVLFSDGHDGRAFTLKAETSDDLYEWKTALEEVLANAPSAALMMGQNGIFMNDQADAADASIELSKDRQPVQSSVIGRPVLLALEEIDGTPSFLEKALKFLEVHGVKVEGILRQAADVDDVERRIREYEQGKNEFSVDEDPHVIGDCIKYLIRELPSSPVPASCCNALVEAFRADRGKRVNAMHAAISETFPEPNRRLLQRILMMMQTVASHKAENRMSTSAVAACMAPLLLRPLLAGDCEFGNDFDMGGDGSIQLLQAAAAANHAQAIVITLLEEYDYLFGEGSICSELYSDSEESGSDSEELSDDGTFEDDDVTEVSDTDFDADYEIESSGTCLELGDTGDNVLYDHKGSKSSELSDDPAPEPDPKLSSCPSQSSIHQHDILEESKLQSQSTSHSLVQANDSGIQKAKNISNGSAHSSMQPDSWGYTHADKDLAMESIVVPKSEDELLNFSIPGPFSRAEIKRLEAAKSDLQRRIMEEVKGNAILQEDLEKRKNALHEHRLALEQDVERLQEQLQKEIELRTALEAGLKISQGTSPASFSVHGKVKAHLEDIALVEADIINLKQKADDLVVQLNQQRVQNCGLMHDSCNRPKQNSNHQVKLKDKQKDLEATTKRSLEKSSKKKGQLNNTDVDKDVKQESSSFTSIYVPQNQEPDTVKNSNYAGIPSYVPSVELGTVKVATTNSTKQGAKSEGATSTSSALSKLTNRLNFLKERRTQIASEIQNFDKGRNSDQAVQNPELHSSVRGKGSGKLLLYLDRVGATDGSSLQNPDKGRTPSPDTDKGKSESFANTDKGRSVPPPPPRTFEINNWYF